MYRLRINGELTDLDNKTRLQLNKLLVDLKDLTKRGINFTNAVTLPDTGKNRRLTGYPNRLASSNQSFETRQDYQLLDESTIISTGKVVIKEYNPKRGIKVQLAEGYDFWNDAGSKLLNDLELHAFDFTFTTANMNAKKSKASDVFISALHSATGNTTDTALSSYQYTRPCYYWKRLLDLVAEDLGYSIDYGDTLTLTELNSVGNLSNTEKFFVSDFKRRFQNVNQNGNIDYTNASSVFSKSSPSTTQAGSTLTNGTYKTSYVIKGQVTSAIETQISFSNGDRIAIPKGTSFINYRTDELEISSNFVISFDSEISLDDVYIYSAINEADIFEVDGAISIDNYLVLADYNLPNQTFKQFIKIILSLFFMDIDINNDKKEITLRYLPDIISTNNVSDYSKKVIRNAPYTAGKLYGRLSIFSYQNDDEINEDFGKAFVNIPNENAPETKSIIGINEYSASNEIEVSGESVVSVPIYNTSESKRESVRDRIVYFNEVGSFGINATFSQISWQRLYANHYLDFVQATKRERVSKLNAYLTNTDYRTIQRSPIIYIDWMEATFLVTEIKGFEKNRTCILQVIKYN